MNGTFRCLFRPLCVLILLVSAMAMAGGGHNSTSPVAAPVQLASILCNLRSDSSLQGPVRNNSLNASVAATRLHKSGLCQSLASYHPSWKRKKPAARRQIARERSGAPGHSRAESPLAANSARAKAASRDSFKQEAWFVHKGGQHRRVTKHLARKQGWSGPEALQTVPPSRLDNTPIAAAARTDHRGALTAPAPAPAALVTDCATCELVETGLCERQGLPPVPFRMLRHQGIVAVPRFEPGTDSAIATSEAAPVILVRKFRFVDGTIQPDMDFSDDGDEDCAVPLPVGERVTAFTLARDKLVVLSRPVAGQELSRVTLINIDDPDSAGQIDGGASSGLWVKGELLRYLDNILYTVSREERKLFLYPHESDNPRSLSSIKTIDLSAPGLADGELVSALADREACHVAVRRRDRESDALRIHLYLIDDSGDVTGGEVITESGDTDASWQLHFDGGQPVLVKAPSPGSGFGSLVCPARSDDNPGSPTAGHSVQKRSERQAESESGKPSSSPDFQPNIPYPGAVFWCENNHCTILQRRTPNRTDSNSSEMPDIDPGLIRALNNSCPPRPKGNSARSSAEPAAIVVAVGTALGTACLTAGFLGCEGKKRQELAPME